MILSDWSTPFELGSFVEASLNRHQCWLTHGDRTIDEDYEELIKDPMPFLRRFVRAAGIPASEDMLRRISQTVLSQEANEDIPGHSFEADAVNLTVKQESAVVELLKREKMRDWQKKYHYN
eukprot:CAMPEP_0184686600 /NCGR_PEP_ID=MMETSP0312-20130426/23169_1 /TAXON_ID=31354 /ORGANISM="Compsopogon coeruleus, Strain SAG 36.94" /LENGTH=120 /DNA_ID=CAMNT_0027141853 /DNA_START=167 /DNA_END=529 /DNA_ORIENTATION=+